MTPELTVLAAELALGLLEGPERVEALRRSLAEPEFAHAVEQWRTRFAGLFAEVPEAEPGRDVERAILAGDNARQVTWWRWATAVASAAAAVLLAFVVLRPPATLPAPVVVSAPVPTPAARQLAAAMDPAARGAKPFGAIYDPVQGEVRLAAGVAPPAGKVAELWVIGSDGVPKPIGLLKAEGPSRLVLTITDRAAINEGVTLAISIEPPGGSPTGAPTGPVVATGALTTV